MEDELSMLEAKKRKLLAKQAVEADMRASNERKKKLKAEIFALEHPVQAKVGTAVLNMFKPRPGQVGNQARKNKLKKKVATVADVDKALQGLMRM